MKKSLFIAAALLSLTACTREMDVNLPAGDMTITARTETSADTKTIVEGETHVYWEPGDEIAVFSGDESAKFTTDITESSATATFHSSLGKTNGADIWAVYPYSSDAVFDGETITTTLPSEQVARYGSFGKDMNLAVAHSTTSDLQFYNVGGGIRFRLTQEGIKKVTFEGYGGEILAGTVKIGLDENGLPVIKEVTNGSTAITLLPPSGNDSFPTNVWFYCVAIPGYLSSGYKLEFYRDTEYSRMASEKAVAIKRAIFGNIDNADEGCEFIPIPNTISTPEIIDLGLSVKWASFNLGASKPEEYGDYYGWGETEPFYLSLDPLVWKAGKESGYDYASNKYINKGLLTKYNLDPEVGENHFVDGKTILDPEDDAAHVNLGGKWRMPTHTEWMELWDNCSFEKTTVNDVLGFKVTSNITGNSIFFPATGYFKDTSLNKAGKAGYFWSSSLLESDPGHATFMLFESDESDESDEYSYYIYWSHMYRFYGLTIRPVYDEGTIVPPTPVPDPVDLGLSVKWASFNVGATKPEEYGDYYAWGETEPKDDYSWATYKWCKGSDNTLTKYSTKSEYGYNGFTDTKTVLDPEDDAAHVNFGGSWRMPTDAEWTELRNNCTWTWTTQNGVNGHLVTASNGNSIFLPAGGGREGSSLPYPGSCGNYWSSSLYAGYPYDAWCVESGSDEVLRYGYYRYYGQSVRPVYEYNSH